MGTKDPAEAKRLHRDALARIEARIAAARAQLAGQVTRLTPRDIAAIAGEVYRAEVATAEAAPGAIADREVAQDALLARVDGNHGNGEPDDREFSPAPADIEEARDMLAERGVAADASTLRAVATAIFEARTYAAATAVRRAAGDWITDAGAARFPLATARPTAREPTPRSAATAPVSMSALLERFARENPQAPKGLVKRRGALKQIKTTVGHDDATRVTKTDVVAMKDRRLVEKTALATVAADIASLRPVWAWGISNGLLPEPNPFAGTSPRARRGWGSDQRQPFTEDEAAALLTGARRETGWLRWVPWVLAFTGARLGEVCDAAASDVRQMDGVWCLAVHEEAEGRTLKTAQSQRIVPLADALIAEGFVQYAIALPPGSALFPDLAVGAWDKRSSNATKTLGRRLRAAGISDPRKVAGHSWRHRMKDLLRFARLSQEAQDGFLGHDNATNAGGGYGQGWRGRPAELKAEIERAPLAPPGLDATPLMKEIGPRVAGRRKAPRRQNSR